MSELSESHGENQLSVRRLSLDQIRGYGLREGDIITDLDGENSLATLEARIFNRMMDGVPIRYDLADPKEEHTPLKEELRPKKFHGKLVNVQALILPETDMSVRDPRHAHSLSMLLTADMKSTGRVEPVGVTSLVANYKRRTTTYGVSRKLSRVKAGDQSKELMDSLAWESSAARHVLTAIALGQTVSAGLPSLGKDN